MYLHLGKGRLVDAGEIVGVFDLDNSSQSHITRKYLSQAEKAGQVINVSEDIPKSFVVCFDGESRRLYLCQMAAATLLKRAETGLL